jgi:hypothetical protein
MAIEIDYYITMVSKNSKIVNLIAAKNPVRPSKGMAEGGCGGNSAAPERIQTEASPAALLVQSRTPKKSFVFLLEEKIGRAQNQKCEQNFSLVGRALASGGGAERQPFRSKWVRAFSNKGHQY